MTLKTQQNKHQLEADICVSIFYQSIFPAPSFLYFIIEHIAPENGIATVYPIHLHLPDWPGNVLRGTWHLSARRYHRKGKDGHHLPHIHLFVHLSVCQLSSVYTSTSLSIVSLSICLHPPTYYLLSSISIYSIICLTIIYVENADTLP